MSILLPALSLARAQASQVKCLSNLRQLGHALVLYNNNNRGYNVPSYNLPYGKTKIGTGDAPADGWAPILERDGLADVGENTQSSVFNCPNATIDFDDNKGSCLWPTTTPGKNSGATTITDERFNKIIRVGYWINAENPISRPANSWPDDRTYYTCSPGYGPMTSGGVMGLQKITNIKEAPRVIVLADGIYAGRQGDVKVTDNKCRIGYRHKNGGRPSANVAFADGHAETLTTDQFPRAWDTGADNVDAQTIDIPRIENAGSKPTLYANPSRSLQ